MTSVVFLGRCDNANLSHRVARGIVAAGGRSRVVFTRRHPFGYVEDIFARGGKVRPSEEASINEILRDGWACSMRHAPRHR